MAIILLSPGEGGPGVPGWIARPCAREGSNLQRRNWGQGGRGRQSSSILRKSETPAPRSWVVFSTNCGSFEKRLRAPKEQALADLGEATLPFPV